ncbi:substrate-binding periplasmic protein [Pseudomonas sp. CFBP 13727]|uniref:substrate-binding periplasmic protein n=1 Tax=Pseudomonas sp. CFBP 13727 TaxID=2775295 RepID=UPI00177C08E2|nr:transporter substrate-binding domain-containing protein [Pseudomonas sp. CFBP 13727]MBD8622099.1 transporter substrate-binding domain-containing protein [Pseudomonas sp. CFBP 13727]
MKHGYVKAALPRLLLAALVPWVAALWASDTQAAQEVRIGAAHFPPYVVHPEQGRNEGLLPSLIEQLNQVQTTWHFVLVPTSIARRYQDFERGRVDMAIFENPLWGWQRIKHSAVDLGLEDAEVFVALKQGNDQDFFADLNGKRMALFYGYHYAFADFDANPQYLLRRFNAVLTYSHESNLMMVVRKRADIAMVTRSFLSDFVARNPDIGSQLLVSQRLDQIYRHYALIRPGAPISAEEFTTLIQHMHASGRLLPIFAPAKVAVLAQPARRVVVRNPAAKP